MRPAGDPSSRARGGDGPYLGDRHRPCGGLDDRRPSDGMSDRPLAPAEMGGWTAQLRTRLGRLSDAWIVAVFLGMVVVFAITAPGFVSLENAISTAQYTTEYLLLALGETFVILTAG